MKILQAFIDGFLSSLVVIAALIVFIIISEVLK